MKDPRYNTSLYNHKPMGSIDKPLISQSEYKQLLEEVKNGNYDAYYNSPFTIEPKQEKLLTDIINNRIL